MLPVLDEKEFTYLQGLLKNKMPMLIQTYFKSAEENMAAMAEAFEGGDVEGVALRAHAVKSSSGNMGLKRLYQILNEIEEFLYERPDFALVKNDLAEKVDTAQKVYTESCAALIEKMR